jgi:hypothetical protein
MAYWRRWRIGADGLLHTKPRRGAMLANCEILGFKNFGSIVHNETGMSDVQRLSKPSSADYFARLVGEPNLPKGNAFNTIDNRSRLSWPHTPRRISTTSQAFRKCGSAPRNSCASARCHLSIIRIFSSTWATTRTRSAPIVRPTMFTTRVSMVGASRRNACSSRAPKRRWSPNICRSKPQMQAL